MIDLDSVYCPACGKKMEPVACVDCPPDCPESECPDDMAKCPHLERWTHWKCDEHVFEPMDPLGPEATIRALLDGSATMVVDDVDVGVFLRLGYQIGRGL